MTPEGKYTARIVNRAVPNKQAAYGFLKPHLMADIAYQTYPSSFVDRINMDHTRRMGRTLVPFLDIDLYLQQFMRFSDEQIWRNVMTTANRTDVSKLARAWHIPEQAIPDEIAKHNALFYGFMPIFALTPVFGAEIDEVHEGNTILTPYAYTVILADAIYEASEFFKTAATSMQTLQDRVGILFPAEHADKQPHSAYSFLEATNAFMGSSMECPVKGPTLYFFEAFGQALTEDYGTLFTQRVLSREFTQTGEEQRKRRTIQ